MYICMYNYIYITVVVLLIILAAHVCFCDFPVYSFLCPWPLFFLLAFDYLYSLFGNCLCRT